MTFQDAYHNDPLVNRMLRERLPLESIVAALATRHAEMVLKLMDIEFIAPKKYLLPDGTIRIWRCPEDLLPLHDLTQPATRNP